MNKVLPVMESCSSCPIRHRAVCARCDEDELEQLNQIKFYKTYTAGQTIAMRGDALDVVASVVAGTATLERAIEDGRTQLVGLLLPSDFIGRPGRDTLQYDVTAVTDVTLCCFQRKPFESLLIRIPHVQERLLEMALDELDAARDWMLLLGRKTAREKIASFLMLIAKRTVHPDGQVLGDLSRIELPISREAMANFLGLTIETVSRQFTGLRKDGVIELDGNRSVRIPDLETLLLESGDDSDGGPLI
ncbi:transcriptional activator protein FnrL [Tateyamaria omphalii]|uniref:transcriptional regulator FnrL n=1 Tax=Tateyamaria omphalii TaxID=299262 RepID=UPI001672027E|nr:Crp/Fnr family transcriptional regulator [Tateyamaria omphalii]GGX65762.1 transcriptional activator protein FnrL [Tateyamaria omphalii]